MSNETLFIFGDNNLQNEVITIQFDGSIVTAGNDVQAIQRPRTPGSAVVNTNVQAKTMQFSGHLDADADATDIQEALAKLDRIVNVDESRMLRVISEYEILQYFSTIPTFQQGSGSALTTDVQIGDQSAQVTPDAAGDVEFSVATGVNYSLLTTWDVKSLQLWLYVPSFTAVREIVSIALTVKNSAGQTIATGTTRTNYEDRDIALGWNLLAWQLTAATPANADYVVSRIELNGLVDNTVNFKMSGVMLVNEDRVRNFPSYWQGEISKPGYHYNIDNQEFDMEFFNHTGWGRATFPIVLVTDAGTANYAQEFETILKGSADLEIEFDAVQNANGFQVITQIGTPIRVSNILSEERAQMTATPSNATAIPVNDRIEIGGPEKKFSVYQPYNNQTARTQADYDGVLPVFKGGIAKGRVTEFPDYGTIEKYTTDTNRVNSSNKFAQSFTTPATLGFYLQEFRAKMIFKDIITDNLKFFVHADSAGAPGAVLAAITNGIIYPRVLDANILVEAVWDEFTLGDFIELQLAAATKYHFVVDVTNAIGVGGAASMIYSVNNYVGHKLHTYNGAIWTELTSGGNPTTMHFEAMFSSVDNAATLLKDVTIQYYPKYLS